MFLGAHESIAGGVHKALARGVEDTCEAVQIFSKNANAWHAKPLTDSEIGKFKSARIETGIAHTAVHDSYLINLASPKDALFERSKAAFLLEMQRAEALGIPHLIFHPGAHTGAGEDYGVQRVADALDHLFYETPMFKLVVLIETTAGQGSNIGYTFEQIRAIIDKIHQDWRIGVCYDTCHTFAAGYDIRTGDAYRETFDAFDAVIGLERLKAFHLNDALKPLGSRIDRHEQIGAGAIGLEGFKLLVNDTRFKDLPGYLETPPLANGELSFKHNLAVLRGLVASVSR